MIKETALEPEVTAETHAETASAMLEYYYQESYPTKNKTRHKGNILACVNAIMITLIKEEGMPKAWDMVLERCCHNVIPKEDERKFRHTFTQMEDVNV